MTRIRTALTAATALIAALVLTGCSNLPETPATPADAAAALPVAAPAHNDADVTFLQMMIAHNGQSTTLTSLAADRAVREEVKLLAAAIEATQQEEVKIMESWLQGWNKPTTFGQGADPHANHGGLPATGDDQIAALRKASGADFETTFLSLLTGHQHNAVEMTQLVTANGVNPQTRELARRIKESRSDQIAQMLRLMNG
jgi:uncharacterized protein (DUF305 family)